MEKVLDGSRDTGGEQEARVGQRRAERVHGCSLSRAAGRRSGGSRELVPARCGCRMAGRSCPYRRELKEVRRRFWLATALRPEASGFDLMRPFDDTCVLPAWRRADRARGSWLRTHSQS